MPNDLGGVPLHPLVVHATVVVIPTAALVVLLAAVWPRFARWAGPLPFALSVVGLVLVPLSTSTGETLQRHVRRSALLERHTHLADGLLPWMIGLVVVAAACHGVRVLRARDRVMPVLVRVAVTVLAALVVAGTTVQVVRIGHSGARAAWQDTDMHAATPR